MKRNMEDPFAAFENKELYELTVAQARELLGAFLANEKKIFSELRINGINLDYSRDSVFRLFEYVISHEFDKNDPSSSSNNIWFLRLAYYFGESLRNESDNLHWAVGRRGSAEENHPVITGFADKSQAALITIVRNILVAVVVKGEPFQRIERAVEAWFETQS
jgi:hypothetical protein